MEGDRGKKKEFGSRKNHDIKQHGCKQYVSLALKKAVSPGGPSNGLLLRQGCEICPRKEDKSVIKDGCLLRWKGRGRETERERERREGERQREREEGGRETGGGRESNGNDI